MELCNEEDSETQTDSSETRKRTYSLTQVNLTAQTIKEALTTLVTTDGRPFSIISDKGIRMLLDPILNRLPTAERFVLNQTSLKEMVMEKAVKVKNLIKDELKRHQMISIKLDIASRHSRSFLGINAQYINQSSIKIRTLGVIELYERNTSENLKQILIKVLADFDLPMSKIYSITSDNGSNMIKLNRILRENQSEEESTEEDYEEAPHNDEDDEFTFADETEDEEIDTTEDSSEEVPNLNQVEQIVEDCIAELKIEQSLDWSGSQSFKLEDIRCGVHTLQLAVEDGIRNANLKSLLAKVRSAVKHFR